MEKKRQEHEERWRAMTELYVTYQSSSREREGLMRKLFNLWKEEPELEREEILRAIVDPDSKELLQKLEVLARKK